ncbi:hypothetical protein CC77DRAFT_1099988 [Alternaria alternata]|uniref:DUF7053 domain-containing protein n=2 Tax=Alternaria alternata complex TaxID=187734 RepID=A0A177D4L3_ALTAL|nr:hypothetical protein CC77DRAFT_1099988 [Alternaria alternata]OAG14438.1 hypothetical protein CC77DRAFT_1099988 [Alternaria alternata]RYN43571.1 hypothetical protein AA0114_g10239 [Alternaria tenuissima]RYN63242.1 hypothetical protein AA0118_g4719 [Alternaria tenuissima]
MPKTAVFTTITPLPAGITRKSVLDMYRDHLAMIDLNPLVVERFKCRPPSYAPTDEYWAMWYTIKDKVSYLPGGLATGSVSYHACFTDTAEGLNTHVYAPLGLDIQGKWTVGGRLPGEPKPPAEPGLKTPRHGLYIREDVKMTCSALLMSFVKRTFKDSHGKLVDKLVEKAHILESNFANERLQALRNVAPGERMGHGDIFIAPPPDYDYQPSPTYLQVPSPRFVSHTRSQSDPVLSPGFSSSSTLNDPNDSPFNKKDRPTSFTFVREEKEVSSSAPEATSFLLPATTYDGGFSQRRERSASLYPGSSSDQHFERMNSERMISLLPLSPTTPAPPQDWNAPEHAPRISYTPEERPISFTFPFDPKHPFDRKSTSETSQSDQQNLLDDIDDAIDEFMYTLPAATYSPLPATTYSPQPTPEPILSSATYTPEPTLSSATYNPEATLTSATYKPEPILSSAVYDPRHARKDSAMPSQDYADERPPVPLKDDKYRKGSLRG